MRVAVLALSILAALVFGAARIGVASSLAGASKSVASASVTVPQCDTDGITVVQNLSGSNVVGVTVTGIASACGGGTLSADVNNGSANSSGSAAVPAGGGSVTVTLASAVAAKDSEEIDVAITGP